MKGIKIDFMYRGNCIYCGTEVECHPARTKTKGLISQDNNLFLPKHLRQLNRVPDITMIQSW